MNQKKLKFVDAICGSGKSHRLKEYILSFNSEAIPERFLIVVPTHQLAEQFKTDLTYLNISTYHINVEGATKALKSALEDSFNSQVVITTHECFTYYCYQATFKSEMQKLLSDFHIFIDELPPGFYGGEASIDHDDVKEDNFPFLSWMEERDGLLYIKEENKDLLYKHWHEKHANSDELKRVLYAVLDGQGILHSENDKKYSFFAQTYNPMIKATVWATSLTLLGAGASRCDFVWAAQNIAQIDAERANECLFPDPVRRTHKKVPVKIYAMLKEGSRATITQMAEIFNNHLMHVKRLTQGESFIYATNADKQMCDFQTIGANELGDAMGGLPVSMSSYGINSYQHTNAAVFLGCANMNNTSYARWIEYCECNRWDAKAVLEKKRQSMYFERCYQFLSRTSIRNSDAKNPLIYIVPDMEAAEYLKEHYFHNATIECVGIKKQSKSDSTYETVHKYKAQGLKQKQVAEIMQIGIATVKRHWKENK